MRTTAVWIFVATLVLGGTSLVYATDPKSDEPAASTVSAAPAKSASAATANGASDKTPPEVEKALQMPEGDDRIKALVAAATAWAKQDPTAAMAWSFQLPKKLSDKVVIPVILVNPAVSADWLIQNKKTGVNNGNLHGVLVTWGRVDPAASTAWVQKSQIADKDIRATAFFSVADGYARRNCKDAGAWAEKVEAKEDRMEAIRGVAMMWGRGDVTTATPWIKQLKPEEMRVAIKTITGGWWLTKLKSPEATTKTAAVKPWLDQFPLSDKEKEDLLK